MNHGQTPHVSGLFINSGAGGFGNHADWTGPGYLCFGTSDGLAFADVNGDGRPDILTVDTANFDAYTAYYSQTGSYRWRLNNGDPNIEHWPTTQDFLSLRATDPGQAVAPFVDLDNDTASCQTGPTPRSPRPTAGSTSRRARRLARISRPSTRAPGRPRARPTGSG